jgi:hypothetical protein
MRMKDQIVLRVCGPDKTVTWYRMKFDTKFRRRSPFQAHDGRYSTTITERNTSFDIGLQMEELIIAEPVGWVPVDD